MLCSSSGPDASVWRGLTAARSACSLPLFHSLHHPNTELSHIQTILKATRFASGSSPSCMPFINTTCLNKLKENSDHFLESRAGLCKSPHFRAAFLPGFEIEIQSTRLVRVSLCNNMCRHEYHDGSGTGNRLQAAGASTTQHERQGEKWDVTWPLEDLLLGFAFCSSSIPGNVGDLLKYWLLFQF